MNLKIFTDGGSKGNPGPAAIGVVIYDASVEGKELLKYREDIGVKTNNEAEYTAVIRALELVLEKFSPRNPQRIDFYADSQLLVRQLNGEYKIKTAHIRDLIFKIRVLESQLRIPIYFHHVMREKNMLADALVNDAV